MIKSDKEYPLDVHLIAVGRKLSKALMDEGRHSDATMVAEMIVRIKVLREASNGH